MRKHILFATLPALVITFFSQNVSAHNNMIPVGAVKASSVISMIESKGYRDVRDFDFYKGVYVVKAVDKDNELVKIRVDALTNEILNVKDTERHVKINSHPVSMLDAVKKVEWAGFRKIYDVDFEHGQYEILGFNVNDQRVEFLVNPQTGAMTRTH